MDFFTDLAKKWGSAREALGDIGASVALGSAGLGMWCLGTTVLTVCRRPSTRPGNALREAAANELRLRKKW